MGGPLKLANTADMAPSLQEILELREMRDLLGWFSKERHWINEQHLQLCRVPAPTFLEQKRADWMVTALKNLGWDSYIDKAGNVIASMEAKPQPPYIGLTAHLDTVLAPRVPEDITFSPDGTLRGPGVSDNGAGLAALLAIARACKTEPRLFASLPASLLLVANVGEEGEGNLSGMRHLCRSPLAGKFSAFLVLDGPSLDHITGQALASRRFEVAFSGAGGHSWSDFGMGNPVHALSRAIALFTDKAVEIGGGPPRMSFNFGTIDGGSTINAIPTAARAKLDVRSESGPKIDELVEVLTACVERAQQIENERSTGGRVAAKIKEIGSRPGGHLPDGAPLLQHLRAIDQHLGIKSHLDCASTDANIPLSMGIPAASIGAGGQGGGAHTPAEWYKPDAREVGLKRILLALYMLLNEA